MLVEIRFFEAQNQGFPDCITSRELYNKNGKKRIREVKIEFRFYWKTKGSSVIAFVILSSAGPATKYRALRVGSDYTRQVHDAQTILGGVVLCTGNQKATMIDLVGFLCLSEEETMLLMGEESGLLKGWISHLCCGIMFSQPQLNIFHGGETWNSV